MGPVAVSLVAATAVASLDLTIWPGGPGSQLVWLVAGLLGGAVAVCLDDPAATLTRATPTPGRRRAMIRLLVAVVALTAWSGYAARVVDATSLSGEPVSWLALVIIGTALVLAAAGPAAALGRAGPASPDRSSTSMAMAWVLGLMVYPPAPRHRGVRSLRTLRTN